MKSFDYFFESIKDSKVCNSFTEKTFAYRLRYEFIIELYSYGMSSRTRYYTREKFKTKIGYINPNNNNKYSTKKDLMQGENLTRTELSKNINKYSYEIKELAQGTAITPSNRPRMSYRHKFTYNQENVKNLIKRVTDGETDLMYSTDFIILFNLDFKYNNGNHFLNYERKDGGRLVNFGGEKYIGIQNLEKSIREQVFEGYYEIDIENSAPTILYQTGEKYHKTHDFPKIKYYIDNKEKCRQEIVDLGFSYKEAKEFYLAIFFGANLGIYGVHTNSWANDYGVDKIQYILQNTPSAYDIYDECKKLFSYLKKSIQNKFLKKDKNGKDILYNSRGNKSAKYMSKWNTNKAIMHYYFGIESQILDLITKNYSHDLLLYDAFITKEDVNLDELSLLIEQELGYKVKFSKRLIKG
jgi:hypothetical protein